MQDKELVRASRPSPVFYPVHPAYPCNLTPYKMPYRILIADDDPKVCTILQRTLEAELWVVQAVGNGREALDALRNSPFDVAVLDLSMPHLSGLEVLKAARQKGIRTDVIILTGYGTIGASVQAMKVGARDFIEKPIDLVKLTTTIRELLENRHLPPHVLANRLDDFLKDHLSESALKLGDLCKHFRISPAYVSRLFQRHVHASFRARLAYHRVQKTKQLLESSDAALDIIAGECGFRNYRRLTETFVRLERIPPGKFRRICRDRRIK